MAKIVWTEPALNDLNDIAEYIALDKADAAKKFVKTVFKQVERLIDFPESGRLPPELAATTYREIITGPCRIFYRISSDNIYIVYVMRSERELRKFILEERQNILS